MEQLLDERWGSHCTTVLIDLLLHVSRNHAELTNKVEVGTSEHTDRTNLFSAV
jgi:hypothetical protein